MFDFNQMVIKVVIFRIMFVIVYNIKMLYVK